MKKTFFIMIVLFLITVTVVNISNMGILKAARPVSGTCFNWENSDCQKYELPHGDLWVCQEGYKGHNCKDITLK